MNCCGRIFFQLSGYHSIYILLISCGQPNKSKPFLCQSESWLIPVSKSDISAEISLIGLVSFQLRHHSDWLESEISAETLLWLPWEWDIGWKLNDERYWPKTKPHYFEVSTNLPLTFVLFNEIWETEREREVYFNVVISYNNYFTEIIVCFFLNSLLTIKNVS